MLDEKALRKPTFRAGREVVMADNQAWNLPLPMVKLIPAETDAGFEVCLDLMGSDNYQVLTKAYEDATNNAEVWKAGFALGRALLDANYTLTFPEIASILQFSLDDSFPDGQRIQREVMSIALGNAPKPSGDGDESSPTQPE